MWANKEWLEMSVMAVILLTAIVLCGGAYLVCTIYEKVHGIDDANGVLTPNTISETEES